jgi:hypothetical protein
VLFEGGRFRLARNMVAGVAAAGLIGACSLPAPQPEAAAGVSEPGAGGSAKRLRILTEAQYLNTVAYVFGPDIRPVATFPPSQRTDGLIALGTSRGGVTTQQLELYQKAALTVSQMAVDPQHRAFLVPCKPASETAADRACATAFLKEKGRLLNRRPLTNDELNAFVNEAVASADGLKDFYAGLAIALEAMLVSPNVLFVTETSEPDPARQCPSRDWHARVLRRYVRLR